MAGNPTLSDFREVINRLDELISEIDAMPFSTSVGAIEMCTGKHYGINQMLSLYLLTKC